MESPNFKSKIQNTLEQAILHKKLVSISYQVSAHKIVEELVILMDLFNQKGSWFVLTETGLSIPLNQIKAIRPQSPVKH